MITENTTIREFLQTLGTECLRNNLSKNIWAAALFADYKCEHEIIFDSQRTKNPLPVKEVDNDLLQYPNWIITDMRFPNEMEAVEQRKGITIKVVRHPDVKVQHSGKEDDFTIEKFDKNNPKHVQLLEGDLSRLHPSETALDDAYFDHVISNNGTIEDLIEKVRQILTMEKII